MPDQEKKGPVAEFKDHIVDYRKRMDDSLEMVITSGATVKSREEAITSLQDQLDVAVTDADHAQHSHVVYRRNAAQDVQAAIDELKIFHGMLTDGLPREAPALAPAQPDPKDPPTESASVSRETVTEADTPEPKEAPAPAPVPVEMTG